MPKPTSHPGDEMSAPLDVREPAEGEEAPADRWPDVDQDALARGGRFVLGLVVVCLLFVAVVGFIAWRNHNDNPAPAKNRTATTAAMTEEQRIIDAYRRYEAVDFAALAAGNPEQPGYADYATGQQLVAARDAVRQLRDQGIVLHLGTVNDSKITVESIDGDIAHLRICGVDNGYPVRATTGESLAPSQLATTLEKADMVREGGSWKASYVTRVQQWPGRAGCAVQ
ncbi:MAG TPA: hypothetical protein VFJ85_14615 [Acidimicrobiales bacterium]|nr:hypothetical protein [Acidimicrobiales bacterium]